MQQNKRSSLLGETLFLAFVFVFLVSWAMIQPFNSGPDEAMRYQIPSYIFQHGTLPHGGDPSIRNPVWGVSYGFYPVFSYIISAFFMKIASFLTESPYVLLMAARMASVVFMTGTVFFIIRIGNRVFQKKNKWFFICLAAFLPQAAFMGTYVNNDAMAIFSTAFIVYMWIVGIETGWNRSSCIGLAVAMSFCTLSYFNAYGFLLCSIFLFLFSGFICHGKRDYKVWMRKALLIMVIIFVLTGWWFIRNAILYDGDFMGFATSNAFAEKYALPQYKPSLNPTPFRQGFSVWHMLSNGWIRDTYLSFIGAFGYVSILFPQKVYLIYLSIFTAGFVGCCYEFKNLFAIKRGGEWYAKGFLHWMMLVSMVITNVLNIYHSYKADYQPQGRYSLPMLIPLMYFTVTGITAIGDRAAAGEKIQRILFGILTAAIIIIIIYGFVSMIIPVYVYGTNPGVLTNTPIPVLK